jgi:hypothetical protein
MNFKIKYIIEGIKNSIFVQEEVEKIANERYSVCKECSKNSSNRDQPFFDPGKYFSSIRPDEHCSVCACNLHAKVRSLHTDCPIDKWSSVATKEEAAKIAAAIDGN